MEENKLSAMAVSDIIRDAMNKTNDLISDFESIKVNASEEDYEDINPVIDSIIEDESNHIGQLQQLIDLLSGNGEIVEEGRTDAIELIDNSDEFMESVTTMKKKLILSENFDNVIDDVQAVADPVFVGANEEHDENKKNYEKAIKENEKNAQDIVPKEGETGEKVTSKELKAMKLAESIFDEGLNPDFAQSIADDISEYILTEFVDLQNSEIREILKLVIKHFSGSDFEESLNEDIKRYSDAVPEEDRRYWYFTLHGVGPGSIPSDLKVLDTKEGQNDKGTWGTYVCLNGVLNTSELKKYDMIEKAPMNESLQVKIAKEQLTRFNEGKMPKNWSADNYIKKLTEKKHITQKEAKSLKEWYNGKQNR